MANVTSVSSSPLKRLSANNLKLESQGAAASALNSAKLYSNNFLLIISISLIITCLFILCWVFAMLSSSSILLKHKKMLLFQLSKSNSGCSLTVLCAILQL